MTDDEIRFELLKYDLTGDDLLLIGKHMRPGDVMYRSLPNNPARSMALMRTEIGFDLSFEVHVTMTDGVVPPEWKMTDDDFGEDLSGLTPEQIVAKLAS